MIGSKKEPKTSNTTGSTLKLLAGIKASIAQEKELAKNKARAKEILHRILHALK